MEFDVETTTLAKADLDEYFHRIALDSEDRAITWLRGAVLLIESLSTMPSRFSVASELEGLGRDIRSVPYHSHRMVYEILDDRVIVLRVWHVAQQVLSLHG
jgi:plasmid stabilization system protein ParE